jgi:hypothetical protein
MDAWNSHALTTLVTKMIANLAKGCWLFADEDTALADSLATTAWLGPAQPAA